MLLLATYSVGAMPTVPVLAAASVRDAQRLVGDLGLQPESTLPVGGGEVSLRAAPDVERTFSGAQTVVPISGRDADVEVG